MATRLLFFGTSAFAIPLLRSLAQDARFELVGVVTQPDRPVGRKAILTAPAIKPVAEELGIPVFQFEKIKSDEAFVALSALSFEAAVVASYGQIIPQRVLDLAADKFINLHGSLLPAYRGASPIAAAIKDGLTTTGVTIMVMDAKMDHGPVLAEAELALEPMDTTPTLSERLALVGAESFGDVLSSYLAGTRLPQEQAHEKATICPLLKREDGQLDGQKTALQLERLIRAYTPWPGTFILWQEKPLKVLVAHVGGQTHHTPGTLFLKDHDLALACGNGSSLVLDLVQPEGKSAMSGQAFANGQKASLVVDKT